MLRLAHRLMSQRVVHFDDVDSTVNKAPTPRFNPLVLTLAEMVVADNVAEYLAESGKTRFAYSDFPNAVSPFQRLWIEWENKHTDFDGHDSFGVHCCMFKMKDLAPQYACDTSWMQSGDESFGCNFKVFTSIEGAPVDCCADVNLIATSDGTIDDVIVMQRGYFASQSMVLKAIVPAFLTLSFMNCKNVRKVDASTSLNPSDKWLRRQKQPRFTYRVLDINPMKEVLRTEGGIEHNGIKKALHICRGHFSTYTADKPLFGNIVGTVWKPAHVRGDIKHGAVVKDYSVSPQ